MALGQEVVHVARRGQALWDPVEAEEARLLQHRIKLADSEKDVLVRESLAILANCPPPGSDETRTGLVLGYVQSGKTMSFTMVSALARDNGYPVVVVIAGTSVPLFRQSEERLKADLGLRERFDRKWRHISNPGPAALSIVKPLLEEWDDPTVPTEEKQTLLVTVMKHHQHLASLNALLGMLDLDGRAVLVIDDEGDHAGLNTLVNEDDISRTYERLITLKQRLPVHGYLLYTATPQAPLLINAIDALSPEFCKPLTPGSAYTGGKKFFEAHSGSLVCTIPDDDLRDGEDAPPSPPDSLRQAMAQFFIGVAAGTLERPQQTRNRSMLVHPSQYRDSHSQFKTWIDQIKDQWLRVLHQPDDDPAKEALRAEFAVAHADISATTTGLPALSDLWNVMERAIRKTNVQLMNASGGKTPGVDWQGNYAWILVGGQAMDRGFTVEGLTVTYMPRGLGVGHADAVQQRARFFGYKSSYLGYCRVWVIHDVRDAFERYVAHEEDLRDRMVKHEAEGKSLKDWKRAFFMSADFSPTRDNVISIDYMQGGFGNQWVWTRAPHESLKAVEQNRQTVDAYAAMVPLAPEAASYPLPSQRHRVASGVSLEHAMENLLVPFCVPNLQDSLRVTGLMLLLRKHLDEHPGAKCSVYYIATEGRNVRGAEGGEVGRLFQGAYPSSGPLQGSQYPGDEALHDDEVTIQVHRYEVTTDAGSVPAVPFLAVWVPARMADEFLVQHAQ
jgi:hypothetical protein